MFVYKLLEQTVKNGGGTLACPMGRFAWGDLTMLKSEPMQRPKRKREDSLIKAGSFWRPNSLRRQKSHGQSTHAHYDDAYLLMLSGEHVIRGEGSEILNMRQSILEQQDFSRLLLDLGAFTQAEQIAKFEEQSRRFEELLQVSDEDKIAARKMIAGSMEIKDSLDRNNPASRAMKSGGAVGRFMRRLGSAQDIQDFEEWRTRKVAQLIAEHLELYKSLWAALKMRVGTPALVDVSQIFDQSSGLDNDFECLISESRGPEGLRAAERLLAEFHSSFAAIQIRPFCKNAAHVVRELKLAGEMCQKAERAELKSLLRKIRRGIRWMFALDALQMQVIRPLSLLHEDLYSLCQRERNGDGTYVKGSGLVLRSAAPQLFAKVEEGLEAVREKIRTKCRNKDLDNPIIKERVEGYLGTAQASLARDDWRAALDDMRRAARCM